MKKRNVEVAGKIGQVDIPLRRNSGASFAPPPLDVKVDQFTSRAQFGRRSDSSSDQVDVAKQARAKAYQDAIKAQMEEKQRRVEQEKARIKADDLALERKISEASRAKSDVEITAKDRPSFLDEPNLEKEVESTSDEQIKLTTPSFLQDGPVVQPQSYSVDNRLDVPEVAPSRGPSDAAPGSWLGQPSFLQDPVPGAHAPLQEVSASSESPSYPTYSYYAAQYQPSPPPPMFNHEQPQLHTEQQRDVVQTQYQVGRPLSSTMFDQRQPQLQHTRHETVQSGAHTHQRDVEDDDVELDCETALVML